MFILPSISSVMDPLSITASVAGIAATCLRTAKTLNDLRTKYNDASLTMASICSETTIIGTTLAKIQMILLNKPYILTPELHATPGSEDLEVKPTFDIALAGCGEIYSCLEIEVKKLHSDTNDPPGWKDKSRFLWNEDRLKQLLSHLRAHQSAITLLITVIQIETSAEIHRIVAEKSKTDVLETTITRTRSLRALYPESRAPQSIFESPDPRPDSVSFLGSSVFNFDDEIVNSDVYRKTLVSARHYGKKSSNSGKADTAQLTGLGVSPSGSRPLLATQKKSDSSTFKPCGDLVMGQWATLSRSKFSVRELRFDTTFVTPWIFVAPPTTQTGPVSGAPVHYFDGLFWVRGNIMLLSSHAKSSIIRSVKSKLASWVVLLNVLSRAEGDSRDWDAARTGISGKTPTYGLAVGFQHISKSWSHMPPNVGKPYATTALSDLVEICAMLGIHWKVFVQNPWDIRAEGNGFLIVSRHVEGLGLMVNFHITGRFDFQERRIIPTSDIKNLCWGHVPSVLDGREPITTPITTSWQNLGLRFGEQNDVTVTLEALGCKAGTLELWEKDHAHLFPMSFEIIGLVGKCFRIRESSFRMLPNPTRDIWPSQLPMSQLMASFSNEVKFFLHQKRLSKDPVLAPIRARAKEFAQTYTYDLSLENREAIHDEFDGASEYMSKMEDLYPGIIASVLECHIRTVLESIHDSNTDSQLGIHARDGGLMEHYFDDVLSAMIQETIYEIHQTVREKTELEWERSRVWSVMIFRMLCWFMLHDFHPDDVNILPADLKGSNMPVYIG